MKESPIFARTHDLVLWLLARAESFPRSQRFVLTKRLQDAALDFQEKLVEASLGRRGDQARRLVEADVELGKLRFYLRLCHEMGWLSTGQYGHASRMATEVGRLLGGWMKKAAPSGGT
jgi:four helix bundle protein